MARNMERYRALNASLTPVDDSADMVALGDNRDHDLRAIIRV